MAVTAALVVSAAVVAGAVVYTRRWLARSRREQHIRSYMFPRGLFEKFAATRPGLDLKQQQLVARGLRQFFLAYLKSGCQRVAMPSQVVDDLWHEFILFTRDYATFCQLAFGHFLHHTPAVKLGAARQDNAGLRRVWWYCCLEENINPRKPTRMPLLFVLDRKLGIADGFVYDLDCRQQRRQAANKDGGSSGGQCVSDFSDSSIDGGTDGFGDSAGHGGSDSGGFGDSSGCGGGCGGGD